MGSFAYTRKGKLYAPEFFPASTAEKTAVGTGINIPFACAGKRNALCAGIFSGVHRGNICCGC